MATTRGEEERLGRAGELAGDAAELGGISTAKPPIDTRRAERLANPESAEDEEEDELLAAGPQEHRDEALAASPENQAEEAERIRLMTTPLPDEERSTEEPTKKG